MNDAKNSFNKPFDLTIFDQLGFYRYKLLTEDVGKMYNIESTSVSKETFMKLKNEMGY